MEAKQLLDQIQSMKIQQVNVSELEPHPKNSRVHPQKQIRKIADCIRECGFNVPILINEKGTVIAGHARLLAAMELNLETVPCITASHMSEDQTRAYSILDNQLALMSKWDKSMLAKEVIDLSDTCPDIKIGFDDKEIDKLKEFIENINPDADALNLDKERKRHGEIGKSKGYIVHTCPSCGYQFSSGDAPGEKVGSEDVA